MAAKQAKRAVRAMLSRWEMEAHRLRDLGFAYDGETGDPVCEIIRNLDTAIAHAYGVLSLAEKHLEERLTPS